MVLQRLPRIDGAAIPGIAGAGATVALAGGSTAGLAAGTAVLAVTAASVWLARRRRRRDAQDVAGHVEALQQFGLALAPVWSAQIESSRGQMEQAITALTVRFAEIAMRLDQTLALSLGGAQPGASAAAAVCARSQQELDGVVSQLRDSLASKAEMLAKVQGLLRFVEELQDMARDISQITQQTNLLAVNAAIEAAHAGQAGRGFATMAQEVRALSRQSGETGARISEKIRVIGEEIAATCTAADEGARREREALGTSETTIRNVVDGFQQYAETLAGTTELLRHESEGIKGEVNEALVQLQFQDRVSQIMSHVSGNIDRMPQVMREHGEDWTRSGRLAPLSADGLLAELERTYAMAEERDIHKQPGQSQASDKPAAADITFF